MGPTDIEIQKKTSIFFAKINTRKMPLKGLFPKMNICKIFIFFIITTKKVMDSFCIIDTK